MPEPPSPPVMTQSCLGTVQQACESDDSQAKKEMEKARKKAIAGNGEEKEKKVENVFRRKGCSSKLGKSFILSQGVMTKVKSEVFERRQNVTKSPYQHLPMRLPQFPFLQTLV